MDKRRLPGAVAPHRLCGRLEEIRAVVGLGYSRQTRRGYAAGAGNDPVRLWQTFGGKRLCITELGGIHRLSNPSYVTARPGYNGGELSGREAQLERYRAAFFV